jgi:hypothetical protein
MGNQPSSIDDEHFDRVHENKIDNAVKKYWSRRIPFEPPLDCSNYHVLLKKNPYKLSIIKIRNDISYDTNLTLTQKQKVLNILKKKFIEEWGGMDTIEDLGSECQWYKLAMYDDVDTNSNRMLNKHWFNVREKKAGTRKLKQKLLKIKSHV